MYSRLEQSSPGLTLKQYSPRSTFWIQLSQCDGLNLTPQGNWKSYAAPTTTGQAPWRTQCPGEQSLSLHTRELVLQKAKYTTPHSTRHAHTHTYTHRENAQNSMLIELIRAVLNKGTPTIKVSLEERVNQRGFTTASLPWMKEKYTTLMTAAISSVGLPLGHKGPLTNAENVEVKPFVHTLVDQLVW